MLTKKKNQYKVMAFNIFRLNWILIDIIIIFLLILFLLGVKIFKGLTRWRQSLSNESIIRSKYKNIKINYNDSSFKKMNLILIQNSKFNEDSQKRPSIIIIRTNTKKKITKILTEGLCSYGFNIINLSLKNLYKSNKTCLKSDNQEHFSNVISKIMKIFAKNNKILSHKHIIINYGKSDLSLKSIFNDNNNIGLLLINPRINKSKLKNFFDIKDSNLSKSNLTIIFSQLSYLFLKNSHIKRFQNLIFPQNKDLFKFITLEKTTFSFKDYETILLSKIILLIEKMNNNFQRKS